ncbi:hypothetical protein [Flavobacterium sp. LC2016-01]|uniref:hypothetical protein n=1 Tax=Flavobacterium sp. LC2016-01 TaxID=2675876 RepID=UPI0012BAD4F2|nr:hypothetical protein [Flavobacterium sp. LC2016-01]MTH15099.1 hypothetical protein [Flavobacterium sp. LC2016-01]
MKIALKIVLLVVSTLSYSQNKSEEEVFKTIIKSEIEKNKSTFYIECEKSQTPFNIKEFKDETKGFEISEVTLKEFEKNNVKTNEVWNSELINQLGINSKYYKNKNCLTKEEIKVLFNNSDKGQNVVAISKPIFDNNFENCIVSIIYSRSLGSAYGHSCFLKKIVGIWTIVYKYEYWMS